MSWNIKFDKSAFKELSKLDKPIQKKISLELEKISQLENPRELGKALQGNLSGLWCYRVGDYRIICEIEYAIITISVIRIGDRKQVYK